MSKVKVTREIVKRGGTVFFDFEREFESYSDAFDYMEAVVNHYCELAPNTWAEITSMTHTDGYVITLHPSYHQVTIEVVD